MDKGNRFEPEFDHFELNYKAGKSQVVWTKLVSDLETPVSCFLKLAGNLPNSFLLESVEGGAVRGRYSIIGLMPDVIWRSTGDQVEMKDFAHKREARFKPQKSGALAGLREFIEESKISLPPELPPMSAGIFGYMSYDMVRLIEDLPDNNPDSLNLPEALFIRPTLMIIFDAVKDELIMVTPVHPVGQRSPEEAYTEATEMMKNAVINLNAPVPHQVELTPQDEDNLPINANTSAEVYKSMVEKAKKYISAGDIFQVVLSQRFSAPFNLPPFALYRALRRTNPSPFLFFLNFEDFSIVGSSPEILVRAQNNKVTIRPIAGTRPRGTDKQDDEKLAKELLADPKERAEHLMLLDLGRNDVGRVAKKGTVKVTDSYFLEYYSQVMHIVSNVEGELDPNYDEIDALMAGFPAGTVSGAPKVRAMEIIDELESERRGIYAGCVGYFSASGEMDSCIVLRTSIIKDGVMYVQAGAGIVTDSNPESEQQECINKAKALFQAREEAVRFAAIKSNH